MKIVIDIPTEFEEHFKSDRFEDSLSRIASDIESFGFQLAGRYEKETITMLRKAIKNGTPLPKHHGRLVDADALKEKLEDHHNFFVEACGSFEGMTFKEKARVDEIINCIAEVVNAPTIIEGSDKK